MPDQDLPDYDMDDEDFKFFTEELRERRKFEVSQITFEDMIDRLEKNSGQTVVNLKEAKMLLKVGKALDDDCSDSCDVDDNNRWRRDGEPVMWDSQLSISEHRPGTLAVNSRHCDHHKHTNYNHSTKDIIALIGIGYMMKTNYLVSPRKIMLDLLYTFMSPEPSHDKSRGILQHLLDGTMSVM